MKSVKLFFLFFVASIFLLFNSCEDVTDPADECDKTKWQEVKEPIINLIGHLSNMQYIQSVPFSLDTAQYIEFAGFIQKYYCNGTPSGKFDFITNLYPVTHWTFTEGKLGQAYQFKFQNNQDHLRVNIKLKIYFNHGLTFESQTLVTNFYFKDIEYDEYWLSYVAIFYCINLVWVKIT